MTELALKKPRKAKKIEQPIFEFMHGDTVFFKGKICTFIEYRDFGNSCLLINPKGYQVLGLIENVKSMSVGK
jgi:hypothetical protein